MDLSELQAAQAEYDVDHWIHAPGAETISHSERHLAKLVGKIATIAERYDHGDEPDLTVLDREIIPDLLIFAARLANDRGIDLEAAFKARDVFLRLKFD